MMNPPPSLSDFDDRRDIIGIAIDGETTDEAVEVRPFALQVAIIRADQRSKLGTRGMTANEDAIWISPMRSDISFDPAKGFRHIAGEAFHRDFGEKAVIDRNKNEPSFLEPAWFGFYHRLFTSLPASPVNPENDGEILRPIGRIDVQNVADVSVGHVGKIERHRFGRRAGKSTERTGPVLPLLLLTHTVFHLELTTPALDLQIVEDFAHDPAEKSF